VEVRFFFDLFSLFGLRSGVQNAIAERFARWLVVREEVRHFSSPLPHSHLIKLFVIALALA
jgi:hypothetical protein